MKDPELTEKYNRLQQTMESVKNTGTNRETTPHDSQKNYSTTLNAKLWATPRRNSTGVLSSNVWTSLCSRLAHLSYFSSFLVADHLQAVAHSVVLCFSLQPSGS